MDYFGKLFPVKFGLCGKRIDDKARQYGRAQIAAAVGRQRLFAAGVGGFNDFAVRQVVVAIDFVDEQHAGFRMVVSAGHDLVPQMARLDFFEYPQSVGALIRVREAGVRLGFVNQFPVAVLADRFHESVGDRDADIEIAQFRKALAHFFGEAVIVDHRLLQILFHLVIQRQFADEQAVFGVDKGFDVGMVNAQHAHLRATARTGGFDRRA